MQIDDEPALGWTLVLRRQPVRLVQGCPEGGYTDAYELICCECGDDPDLEYRMVSPRLQRIRGPYGFPAGIEATGSTTGFSTGSSRPCRWRGRTCRLTLMGLVRARVEQRYLACELV